MSIVSIGPGWAEHVTPAAARALERAEVVVGYKTYLDLIAGFITGKEVVSSGMMKEVDRCKTAVERAAQGVEVSLVSSGDAGIYGMAGLVFEVCRERGLVPGRDVEIEVVPGIPALSAGAALLGAPLMHDFAVVSLSDLLTPWDVIEKRLAAAAAADFVVVLYNPRSRKRCWQLGRAREIMLSHRGPDTPVGIVKRAQREGQEVIVTTLAGFDEEVVDMQTVVFIGNSSTWSWEGLMVTPRGYGSKYSL